MPPRCVCSRPWCGDQHSYNKLCFFRGKSSGLWEVQEGVCLLWDGNRPPGTSTVMAGEQPRLRHQSCIPTSLETSAAEDLGSLFLLSEDLKPRDSALGSPGETTCLSLPNLCVFPQIPVANPRCRRSWRTSHAGNFGERRRTCTPLPKSRRVLAPLLPPAVISGFIKVRKSSASSRL